MSQGIGADATPQKDIITKSQNKEDQSALKERKKTMSNSLDFKMSNFQNKEVDNITAIDVNQESVSRSNTNIQHQVIINLPQQPGPLHLGNVYHLNMSQGQAVDFLSKTQCNKFLRF